VVKISAGEVPRVKGSLSEPTSPPPAPPETPRRPAQTPQLDTQKKVPAGVYIRRDGIHRENPWIQKIKSHNPQSHHDNNPKEKNHLIKRRLIRKKVLFYLQSRFHLG
jgi:hypothetical protein